MAIKNITAILKNRSAASITLSVLVSFLFVFAFATSTTTISSTGITATGNGEFARLAIGTTTDASYALKIGGGNLYFQSAGNTYGRFRMDNNFQIDFFDGIDYRSDIILNANTAMIEAQSQGGGWSGFKSGGNSINDRLSMYVDSPIGGSGEVIGLNYTANFSGLNTTGDRYTAFKMNVTDTADPDVTQKTLMDLQLDGTSKFIVDSRGRLLVTDSRDNIFIGSDHTGTLPEAGSGRYNIALGQYALDELSGGESNTALGDCVLNQVKNGSWNTGVGKCAGNAIIGSNNTLLGAFTGYDSWGSNLVFIGVESGVSNRYGIGDTGVGYQTLFSLNPNYSGTGATTAFSDSVVEPGIKTTVTSVGHGLSDGQELVIKSGTKKYDGVWTISNSTADTFDISHVFITGTESDTGNWYLLTQTNNTALGYQAGYSDTTGSRNFFGGYQAGYSNTTGEQNNFIGYLAGYSNTTGQSNLFLGDQSGYSNITGGRNTFIGGNAGHDNQNGEANSYLSRYSGVSALGSGNVFAGHEAGNSYLGSSATYIGKNAGDGNRFGFGDTAVGYFALSTGSINNYDASGGISNFSDNLSGGTTVTTSSAHGLIDGQIIIITDTTNYNGSWRVTNAGASTFDIMYTLDNESNPFPFKGDDAVGTWYLPTITANTALGYQAGYSNTTGTNNFFGGYQSGYFNTIGSNNSILGYQSGYSNTTGYDNVIMGAGAGYSNTTGFRSVAIGKDAGYNWDDAGDGDGYNVLLGYRAGYASSTNKAMYQGNTFIGASSGENSVGYLVQNTFVGAFAGYDNETGNNNTYLGYGAGYNNRSGSDNVFLGMMAGSSELGSNRLYIANNSQAGGFGTASTTALIYGEFDNRFLRINGNLEVVGDIYSAGTQWVARTVPQSSAWNSVTYGNGLFVAVSFNGADRVMTSPDGINWTTHAAAQLNQWWSVTYGNGLFVAVSFDGVDRVMTSPDGINWTARSTVGDSDNWYSVTYGNGLFVAVGPGPTNRVMTSSDGINWTAQTAAAANSWWSVTYGNGLFAAVSSDGINDDVMTSPDGVTWTSRTTAFGAWISITYGNGVFVAVSNDGQVMNSSDGGTTWVTQPAAEANVWMSVAYGNGLFVAASQAGTNRIMTSPDSINWTSRSATGNDDTWRSLTYGNGVFVAVGQGADYVMTSGKTESNLIATNNIYQGGISVYGNTYFGNNVGLGTTSPLALLTVGSSTSAYLLPTQYYNSAYISGQLEVGGSATSTFAGYLDVLGSTAATSTYSGNLWVKGTLRAATSYVGDLIFANNFKFYEDPMPINNQLATGTQSLKLTNQRNEDIFSIDEDGNLTIKGQLKQSTTTEQSVISLGLSWILDQFKTMGVMITDGVMEVAKYIKTPKIITDEFEMKDKATGETYCVSLVNGDWQKNVGACGTQASQPAPHPEPVVTPDATTTPEVAPEATSTPAVEPAPIIVDPATPPAESTTTPAV